MPLSVDQTSWRTTRYDRNGNGSPDLMTPVGMMLHSCEGNRHSSLPWLTTHKDSQVSCHYYVCRNSDVYQLAEDTWRTWHGGAGTYDGIADMNLFIGIECEHKQGQDWPALQIETLEELCRILIARHRFPQSRIIAHRWTKRPASAKKKIDPTDLSDDELHAFIAGLFAPTEPDWSALWGPDYPYRETWGIAQAWRAAHLAGRPWGRALSDEHTFLGRQIQLFKNVVAFWIDDTLKVYWEE